MEASICYRGHLPDKSRVQQLIAEVCDIARTMQWPHACMDEDWHQPPSARLDSSSESGIHITGHCGLKGVWFRPHEHCEPVWLYFNAAGTLTSPFQLALDAEEGYPARAPWIAIKTQTAGMDTHIRIVGLLRYLQGTYQLDLSVYDESGYWATGDAEALARYFQQATPGTETNKDAVIEQ